MSFSERNRIRKAIDSGIIVLADLKFYRNAVAAISFLPDELLSDIFYRCMRFDPWSTNWSRLILVCRRWHRVAMNDGRLWSWFSESGVISDRNLARMVVWEERSKNYPLSRRYSSSRFRSHFIPISHRTRLLHLDGQRKSFLNFFSEVKEMPMLEALHIHVWKESSEGVETLWHVPSFLVEGGAPRLHLLHLDGVAFSSTRELHLLCNLTHLQLERDIDDSDVDVDSIPSLKDFYDILKRSPRLQSLKIYQYIMIHDHDNMGQLSPISLPELDILNLNMDIRIITRIVQFLILPKTIHTSFVARPSLSYLDDIKLLLIHLQQHTRRKDTLIFRSATVGCGHYLDFSASDKENCPLSVLGEPVLFHLILYPDSQHEIRQMLTKVINALPLEKLEILDATQIMSANYTSNVIGQDRDFSPQTWRTLLRLLPPRLTIRIGLNQGMIALVKGVVDAMRRAPQAFPSGRRLKRQRRLQGFGSLPLSKLVLRVSQYTSNGMTEEAHNALLVGLTGHLTTYRDLETGLKPQGASLETLVIENDHGLRAYTFAQQLFNLTGKLLFDGHVWDIRQVVDT